MTAKEKSGVTCWNLLVVVCCDVLGGQCGLCLMSQHRVSCQDHFANLPTTLANFCHATDLMVHSHSDTVMVRHVGQRVQKNRHVC